MTTTINRKLTLEEYLIFNDGTDNRYEFADGELIEMPPAIGRHEDIITFLLFSCLLEIQRQNYPYHARSNGLEVWTGVRTRRPDVSIITEEQRLEIQDKSAILFSAPMLIIEVVSPTCRSVDTIDKVTEYQRIGVLEYWIVDPDLHQITILSLEGATYTEKVYRGSDRLESKVLLELNLTVEAILKAVI